MQEVVLVVLAVGVLAGLTVAVLTGAVAVLAVAGAVAVASILSPTGVLIVKHITRVYMGKNRLVHWYFVTLHDVKRKRGGGGEVKKKQKKQKKQKKHRKKIWGSAKIYFLLRHAKNFFP